MTATVASIQADAIPAELIERDQWVVWRGEVRNGKLTKVPYSASTGRHADSTDSATWAPFACALDAYKTDMRWDGIGFVVSANDPYTGIDLDNHRDPETGALSASAATLIADLDSYAEQSPSGTGVRIFIRGKKPGAKCRRTFDDGGIEIYDDKRFFTVTGRKLSNAPDKIAARQEALNVLYREFFGKPNPPYPTQMLEPQHSLEVPNDEILDRAHRAKNGAKFRSLWNGDVSGHNDDDSAADMALCSMLAFWCGPDPQRIEELFSLSQLGQRAKWRERPDYRERTIDAALRERSEFYEWPEQRSKFIGNGRDNDSEERDDPASIAALATQDFYAYLPDNRFIYIPTRELWPAASVDGRLGRIELDGKAVKASDWLKANRAATQMTWSPGEPMLIKDRVINEGGWREKKGDTVFNLYIPPAIVPGDATLALPWVEHVKKVYPAEADHILDWLAHRVQHPDDKVNHALVLGGAQGIGKDTLLEPVKRAIGPWNFREASPTDLFGNFNGFIKSVILRVSEARDLGDKNRFVFYEHLKTYAAAPPDVLKCNQKYQEAYSVSNVCGLVITTNYKSDGIYLPADDRRHFVAWSETTKDDFSPEYWKNLWEWYEDGGCEHVAAYLADRNLSEFNSKAPPPKTQAFWEIVDANRSPEDADLSDALDRISWPSVITIQDIIDATASIDFRDWLQDRRNRRQIPHRLESAGYLPLRNDSAKDGLWKIRGKRQALYADRELSIRDRHVAASDYMAVKR